MSEKEPLTRNPIVVAKYEKQLEKLESGPSGDLIGAIWKYFVESDNIYRTGDAYRAFQNAFLELCGYAADTCNSFDDFFCSKLTLALESFFGIEETIRIRNECKMIMEFPYSPNQYFPSYRTSRAGAYVESFFAIIVDAINYISLDLPLIDVIERKSIGKDYYSSLLYSRNSQLTCIDNRITMELRSGNVEVLELVKEAILGDNNQTTLDFDILKAIVKSGSPEALDLLGQLLLASRAQEGLRQSILATCFSGTLDSHIYFIRLILENDLCRFSSITRSFVMWSGLNYRNQDQRTVAKCMTLALEYLSNESAIKAGLESNDTLEIYLALWSLCCRDVSRATNTVQKLLDSKDKYKRLVGWYFITHTYQKGFCHSLAVKYLHIRDFEELAWICSNIDTNIKSLRTVYFHYKEDEELARNETYKLSTYPTSEAERMELFHKIAELARYIGNKDKVFKESVFPWFTQRLKASIPCSFLLSLAAYDRGVDIIRMTLEFLNLMNIEQRRVLYRILLNPENPEHRNIILEGLSDRSSYVREDIVERLQFYPLENEDIVKLCEALRSNKSDLRKSIVKLLSIQEEALIKPAINTLLHSKIKNQVIAGVELLDVFAAQNPSFRAEFDDKILSLATEKLSQDVAIQLAKVTAEQEEKNKYTLENGYGLFDPLSEVFNSTAYKVKRPDVSVIEDSELKKLIVPDEREVLELYNRIADVFEKHKDYEYETEYSDGSREKVLLGNSQHRVYQLLRSDINTAKKINQIENYPLADEWINAAGEFPFNKFKLEALLQQEQFSYQRRNDNYLQWYKDLFQGYPIDGNEDSLAKKIAAQLEKRGVSISKCNQILAAIGNSTDPLSFQQAFSIYLSLLRKVPESQLADSFEEDINNEQASLNPQSIAKRCVLTSYYLYYWRNLAREQIASDDDFSAYFHEMWYEYLVAGQVIFHGINDEDVLRAIDMKIIDEDAFYMYFTTGNDAHGHMERITGPYNRVRELLTKYPRTKELLEKTIDRIVSLEENRGELSTPLSRVAAQIYRFDGGVEHFIKLLAALGNTGFHRGYRYFYLNNGELSKTEGLSHLLRCCQPKQQDTPEALSNALQSAKINEKRIIQAAVYAPQWAGLLEKAADIKGLKSAVWFFHAHISERFSVDKETEVAIYSPITPVRFIRGTFDKDWFYNAYQTIGEKRFDELYKNAKYLTHTNSTHRRSQLYTDAVLGKLNIEEIKVQIIEKRNQEKLRAFALIPLDDNNENDALERFEFIQQFKKESRQFGSQRRSSEGEACEVALENLAITTGYGDIDRMTWALESAKIEQFRPLMVPYNIGDISVCLSIAEDGSPELSVNRNGKSQKTVPKEISKDPHVLDIINTVKELREQKSRARLSFEAAMVSRTFFRSEEIEGLLNHPVLRSMITALVFISDNKHGFPVLINDSLLLCNPSGHSHAIDNNDSLIIAHPYDFIENKCWSEYQQHLYHNEIVQPFKQVFREYYPITEDERSAVNVSRRYAGNQVQPRKTVALLKSRGWTADYEEGLQRVWHNENLIVLMHALADWFTPADIEAPTLETITFYSRDKFAPIAFTDIPPVIFSETMRDIDLVVSVAHTGGVDPEASHSTIEMRIAIAQELLAMLSVSNVTFQSAHAQVKGSLGEYSIHMGSGVTHKFGTGMISVLPVHSQARGRIFLPFADDDPKTAEILSKILLFANDKSIKDPSILSQIK